MSTQETHLYSKHGSNVEPKTYIDPSISALRPLNDALTIHQLPIELFLSIFESVLRTEDTAPEYYRQICTLSGVCARWFFMIHHSPQLWTTVTGIIREEAFRSILERSSDNLINFEYKPEVDYDWRYGEVHFAEFFGSASSATSRWRSLVLEIGYHPGNRPSDFLQFPAPNLERLVLKNIQGWDMEDVELFGGDCPNLKHVYLELATCKWSQAAFKGLESLKLFDVFFNSVGTILEIIRESPQLKTLKIGDCAVSEEVPANTQQVSLPNLRFLRVKFDSVDGLTWPTQQFLDHISAPPQCPLYISSEATDEEEDPLEDSLTPTFCKWLFGKQTKEVLEGVESLKLGFNIDEDEVDGSVTHELCSGSTNIKGGIDEVGLGDLRYVQEHIQGLFQRSRAFKTFTTLRLSGGAADFLNNSQFTDLFTGLPTITHLELVKPMWGSPRSSSESLPEGVIFRISAPLQTIKNLTLRDVSPDGILDMVLGVLDDSQAHTQSMSHCRVERLDNGEIHIDQEEFNRVEPVVEVLRNDSRIGKVDVYVAL
ncbi:hypothetical protein FS837_009071 [Tulasnella sp. UAMH 9824]|nr:hypothetical protein FS837_009071 [Tulasnella sp. UAMH 9824]